MSTETYLITGGGGFVGKALCKALISEGYRVRSLSRSKYPELEDLGVQSFQEDLSRPSESFYDAFKDVDGVFHVAAKVDMWGSYEDFHQANVNGTQHVIEACKQSLVQRLVFTSSPSVIAREYDLCGVDESISYPDRYLAYYPQTKALAEKLVLSSNSESLYTCSLRPHLIWGPGDTNLIPTILDKARSGKLIGVGDGSNLVDFSFIDDCVAAHIAAMHALKSNSAARGRSYFISQGEPYSLWEWIDQVLEKNNLPPVSRRIPYKVARLLGAVCELFVRMLPGNLEPRLTRFLVDQMAHAHYFDISAAKKYLSYNPQYSMQEALQKL